eukprot:TRINITY_DN18723_c0_g2_i1.p1 TRINITY_DN18723_c0_g2~~TRINITY_DN18723_c0_g2_i1.p1  ORF type:complete len:377 (+),score=79.62 TRINITY_DN18723_c0_g2_i1:80-1210(+)
MLLKVVGVVFLALFNLINAQSTVVVGVEEENIPTFRVCYTDYVGFTPLKFAYQKSIIEKHAQQHSIKIELVKVPHYVDSIVRFATGEFAACTMTIEGVASIPMVEEFLIQIQNMMFPGKPAPKPSTNTTVLVVAGYSAGNDMIISGEGYEDIKSLKGRIVMVEEGTAQEYMLARALDLNGMSMDDIVVAPSSLDDILPFMEGEVAAIAVRCPLCEEALKVRDAKEIFNSSQIPGEMLDLIVVNSDVLQSNPTLGVVLTSAWYETMFYLNSEEYKEDIMLQMANISGFEEDFFTEFERTKFLFRPKDASEFFQSSEIQDITSTVMQYLFEAGIFDDVYTSIQKQSGILFPQGVMGDKENIRLHFDHVYTEALSDIFV